MTFSLPKFRSFSAVTLALVWTSLTFGAALTPVETQARAATPYYTAEFAAPAAEERAIIGGVVWQCAGTTCLAAKASSRPVTLCKRVARELGEITSFTAGNKALEADELAACNGK
ncbi:CC_3452 family protein [Allopontixanthobacter sediminis]|uniref:Uncharacterized protein n=1 Tax=Allopontixanthobacter sediminis TaxID=1689985 RepID=A0A845B431_9SPHN|nr:hypothetical protein [Allopontixanthobacter sediminis]MXP44177.1 hypothetical protein [Allopontixanthobacter sediminis]